MLTYKFSSENPEVEKASGNLILENANYLLQYIYSNLDKEPYNNPEIRIGLALKIILKTNITYESNIMQPIIDDIEFLLNDEDYLNKFKNPGKRRAKLDSELLLINKYIELSDTISLNHKS